MAQKLQGYCLRWSLIDPVPLAQTPRARLWRVTAPQGQAVLKVFAEPGGEEALGSRLLDWWGGVATAQVWALTREAALMEWLPGPELAQWATTGRDAEAAEVIGAIAARSVSSGDWPGGLHPLDVWLEPLLHLTGDWPRDVHFASALAAGLLASTTDTAPLHGDLHHGNVVSGPRGWCAIDPKGLLGDRAYDVANAFPNPVGHIAISHDPARIAMLAGTFARHLGQPQARILGWAAAHCAVSAIWDRAAGNSTAAALTLLPMLLEAHDKRAAITTD